MKHTVFAEATRMEAFSDAVIAIIMTIMVLEIHVPENASVVALMPLLPIAMNYLLSFVFLGIYWNNHHHLLHASSGVTAGILWANMHLLFWLSLIPFATQWMGEHGGAPAPAALYGCVLLGAALAYTILARTIIASQGTSSKLAEAIGSDFKGYISLVLYVIAIAVSFINSWIAYLCYAVVAIIWIIPDRRISRMHSHQTDHHS